MTKKSIGIFPGYLSYPHVILHEAILSSKNLKPLGYEKIIQLDKSIYEKLYYNLVAIKILVTLYLIDIRKNLTYKNYNIGHCLIETTIRINPVGKFKRNSSDTFRNIKKCLRLIENLEELNKKEKIELIIGADEAYIYGSILGQFAEKYKIDYLFLKQHGKHLTGYKLVKNGLFAGPNFSEYKNELNKLTKEALGKLTYHKNYFEEIQQGNKDYDYMRSAYYNSHDQIDDQIFDNSVVLFLHDFVDSPGIYGHSIFNDQWEWIETTLSIAIRKKQKVVIKIHPNVSDSNKLALELLKKKYELIPFVTFYNKSIRMNKLKDYNVKCILTIFGTVILEAAYWKIPCISSGNTPYISFNLSKNANTLNEYKKLIYQLCNNQIMLTEYKDEDITNAFAIHQINMIKPSLSEIYPYDDMDSELFIKLFGHLYPDAQKFGVFERRDIYLKSEITSKYLSEIIKSEKESLIRNFDRLSSI